MNETLRATIDLVKSIRDASQMKTGRNFDDFFADRIVQSATEPSLLRFVERLSKAVDVSVTYVSGANVAAFMRRVNADDAPAVLAFIRQYPRVVAMVAGLRIAEDYVAALESIEIGDSATDAGVAVAASTYEVPIRVTCLSPLAHGGDTKAGNATIFRRRHVLSTTGHVLELPFFGGNALRGIMRDALADTLLDGLGLTPRKADAPLELWFFYVLYSGGALEENSAATKAITKELGAAGATRTEGLREFRAMLPTISLLGSALGNRIIPGRISVGDLRPRCRQWSSGDVDVAELFSWEFLTRREDDEDHTEHHGMIATTECLATGTVLDGGIDIDTHASDLERSALGHVLQHIQARGLLGANNNRGLGRVEIEIGNCPDPAEFRAFLAEQREAVLAYLKRVGATCEATLLS